MKCCYCHEERVVWLMHPVRDPNYPTEVNKNRNKCYKCFGWPITKIEQELYNVNENGDYLGDKQNE